MTSALLFAGGLLMAGLLLLSKRERDRADLVAAIACLALHSLMLSVIAYRLWGTQ